MNRASVSLVIPMKDRSEVLRPAIRAVFGALLLPLAKFLAAKPLPNYFCKW
jgi:hypothetical protein